MGILRFNFSVGQVVKTFDSRPGGRDEKEVASTWGHHGMSESGNRDRSGRQMTETRDNRHRRNEKRG